MLLTTLNLIYISMKAVIATKYGAPEVLKIQEIEKPIPKKSEVLVKVMATSVTSGDVRIRSLEVPKGFKTLTKIMFGFSKPKVIGLDFAGIVEKRELIINSFCVL